MNNDTFKSNLNYRIIGDGYPVVFLHGFLESMTMWERLNYQNTFQCIYVDLPGHGASKLSENNFYSLYDIAVLVNELLIELELEESAIIGHSMGGYIGLELMQLNEKIEHLVLLNSNFWTDSESKKKDRVRVAEIVHKSKNHFLYEAIPNLFKDPHEFDVDVKALLNEALLLEEEAISRCSIAMSKREDFTDFVKNNPTKLSIVQGRFDAIIPMDLMKKKTNKIKELQLTYVDSGHMTHIENKECLNSMISQTIKNGNY